MKRSSSTEIDEDRFKWLANQKVVWIIRLVVDGKVDYAAVVDGMNGLSFYCEEKCPIKFSAAVLEICGG